MAAANTFLRAPRLAALLLLALAGAALASVEDSAATSLAAQAGDAEPHRASAPAQAPAAAAAPAADIDAAVAASTATRVIVTLKPEAVEAAAASEVAAAALAPRSAGADGAAAPAGAAAARLRAATALKARVFGGRAAEAGATVARDFSHLPAAVLTVSSPAALAALRADPAVASVRAVGAKRRMLKESLPLINQPAAAARGALGGGCAVAILDGGGDYTAADLGGCSAPGAGGACRVDVAMDFTGQGFTNTDAHSTNVASVVARTAPGARILLLDVFSGDTAWDDDVIAAINWAAANAAKYSICSINLSIGDSTRNTAPCTLSPFEAAFQAARGAGVLATVSSGNDQYIDAVSEPACAPSAVTVTAVHDSNYGPYACDGRTAADQVACWANVAGFVDLAAPGSKIDAGGVVMSGTSQAAPHAAAAIAVVRSAKPGTTAEAALGALKLSGKVVRDSFSGLSFPRVDLAAAIDAITGAAAPADTKAPQGWLVLNDGEATASSRHLDVSVAAKDNAPLSGLTMCLSESAAGCGGAWVPYAPSAAYDITTDGDGPKTVYLYLQDRAGNRAGPFSDSITLDTAGPSGTIALAGSDSGSVLVTRNRNVQLTLAAPGATEYCYTTGIADDITACNTWRAYVSNPTTITLFLDATQGARPIKVVFRNAKGLAGPVATATVILDTVAPTDVPSLQSATGAALTSATLSWDPSAAQDAASGVARFLVSYKLSTPPPPGCGAAPGVVVANVPSGANVGSFAVTGLKARKVYRFRLCAVDNAGNVSPGILGTGRMVRSAAAAAARVAAGAAAAPAAAADAAAAPVDSAASPAEAVPVAPAAPSSVARRLLLARA